ncbi:hypothetical protein [Chryseobacterium carnipullorum]|uniref:hypothetical protein n=1 Tax=Chryseobacterium carnipullorum TaxID=1124835 RepID=UPI000E9C0462|nr:hypothetical protein [Chryseobacterium carnipullorum]HBV15329.1 hypothetical protein [Chryseobacterium carnipullorum]
MIKEFSIFNRSGIVIPIELNYPIDFFAKVDNKTFQEFHDASAKGVSWNYNNKRVLLRDDHVNIIGLPSTDLKYIIIIYKGIDGQFKPPNNAVIYNLDGSIHKVLEMSQLISERAKKYLEKEKMSNPPLELSKYEFGLNFLSFDWRKNEKGEVFNYISIQYDRDYGEGRELNPETGEIGRLIDEWYNYY